MESNRKGVESLKLDLVDVKKSFFPQALNNIHGEKKLFFSGKKNAFLKIEVNHLIKGDVKSILGQRKEHIDDKSAI